MEHGSQVCYFRTVPEGSRLLVEGVVGSRSLFERFEVNNNNEEGGVQNWVVGSATASCCIIARCPCKPNRVEPIVFNRSLPLQSQSFF